MPLGQSFRQDTLRNSGSVTEIAIFDNFQYIPLSETLKTVLEQPGVMDIVCSYKGKDDDVLQDFHDGSFYKALTSKLVNEESHVGLVIPILLYYDDFETANPVLNY